MIFTFFVGKRGTIQHPGKVVTEGVDNKMNPDNPVRHVLAGMFRGFERLPSLSSPPENIPRIFNNIRTDLGIQLYSRKSPLKFLKKKVNRSIQSFYH